ncbi:MAG: MBL fold metallo-hydrolase [Candidatus Dormibacteraceae bacterium]
MKSQVTWDRGICLDGHGMWLDPQTIRDLAFVSHAHSDHTRRHKLALMTPQTHDLLPPGRRPHQAQLVGLGQSCQLGSARLEMHDAGHILGSAMLLLEANSERLLYTGDLKLRPLRRPAPTAIPRAQVLVMESTYGEPRFRFPDPEEVLEELARWCRRLIAERVTPVLLANALGKSQEIMLALASHGLSFALESRCVPWVRGYERAGVVFPDWVALDPAAGVGTRVVMAPPAGKSEVRRLARYRTALISGWTLDQRMRTHFGADAGFAYSDHCGFDELVEVAQLSGAATVYTVHGFAHELARHLKRRGIRACALRSNEQLELL